MKNKKLILLFFSIIFIATTGYALNYNYKLYKEEKQIELLKEEIKNPEQNIIVEEQEKQEEVVEEVVEEEKTEEIEELEILAEYKELYEKNNDLIGWITIEDTVIDYPVMQTTTENPNFYIHRDWEKKESVSGIPYIDSRCTLESENTIIYAHNMKDGSMFGSLKNYKEKSFYEKHPIIQFDSIYEKAQYEIIAVLLAKVFYNEDANGEFEFYKHVELDSEEEFNEYVKIVKEKSLYDTGRTAEYGDKLITLCTCHYHVEDGRLLVVAKKNTII